MSKINGQQRNQSSAKQQKLLPHGSHQSGDSSIASPACTRSRARNDSGSSTGACSLHCEMNSRCCTDFSAFEDAIVKKLSAHIDSKFAELDAKIAKKFDDFVTKVSGELNNIRGTVDDLGNDICLLRQEVEDLQRVHRLSDAVITGIPHVPNNNPQQVLDRIASVINFELSPYSSAFFSKPKMNSENSSKINDRSARSQPLIVKFCSVNEKFMFLRKFRQHGSLNLNSIDSSFKSDRRLHVFESLTKENHRILRAALKCKVEKSVLLVTMQQGFVYIKLRDDGPLFKITTLDALRELTAGSGNPNDERRNSC